MCQRVVIRLGAGLNLASARMIEGDLFGFGLRGRALDDEVVVDAEGAGGGVGLHACDGLVPLVVDDTVESDVAVFYDDVDGVEADEADRW